MHQYLLARNGSRLGVILPLTVLSVFRVPALTTLSEAFSIGQIKLHFAQPPDFLGGRSINLYNPRPRASLIVASID